MKNILARGGVEFLAVFLGIALSLWVDDYREDKELNDRITDDYENIYEEVNANLAIIENVISENKEVISAEEEILKILNGELSYNHDTIAKLVGKIYSPTFFGETSAHRTSVASGRFNSSKNDELNRQISSIYEHYFVRLKNNGDWLDSIYKQGFGYTYPFNKAIYEQKNVDKNVIKERFFSDEFHNGLLNFRFARSIYLQRLKETRKLLGQVKINLEKYLVSPSFNLEVSKN